MICEILPTPDTLVVQSSPPTIEPRKPIFHHLRKLLPFSSRTNAVRPVQPHNPLDTATRFDRFEIDSPPPPSNAPVSHFLLQHLAFLTPRHSHGPSVVEVAPGRKVTRLLAAKLPEYRKVNDTRHPPGQQAGAPQDIDSSDVDSLPDVHWCKAFLCYCSCWSHGRPRMPPRWHLQ
ncbi:hypothetical protein DEU56DRAFT_825723, partial [Suillus clintonianus]|uniref:uncharacterized protein n=1 Tax=Suillus clintonianus TaxID=1904413 RepID=UPI001B8736BC